MTTWSEDSPNAQLLDALDEVDARVAEHALLFQPKLDDAVLRQARAVALERAQTKKAQGVAARLSAQDLRREWTSSFADRVARLFGAELDRLVDAERYRHIYRNIMVRPKEQEPAEPFIPIGDSGKKIDVVLIREVAGLQVGISLKGAAFPESWAVDKMRNCQRPRNFGKNVTGRLYELSDEIDVIHRNLPRAIMVAIYYMPIESCWDSVNSSSSFFDLCSRLQRMVGRAGLYEPSEFRKADKAFVGLVSTFDHESDDIFNGIRKGVFRFFDVETYPPREGLPKFETTLSFKEVCRSVLELRMPIETDLPAPEKEP